MFYFLMVALQIKGQRSQLHKRICFWVFKWNFGHKLVDVLIKLDVAELKAIPEVGYYFSTHPFSIDSSASKNAMSMHIC